MGRCVKKPKSIPDSNHVLRYCKPRTVKEGKIAESAFEFRPGEEFLSVNWMEYFGADITADAQVEKVRRDMSKSLKLSANGRFAKLHVGGVKKCVENAEVKHLPSRQNPSHAGIYAHGADRLTVILDIAHLVAPGGVFAGKM